MRVCVCEREREREGGVSAQVVNTKCTGEPPGARKTSALAHTHTRARAHTHTHNRTFISPTVSTAGQFLEEKQLREQLPG